MTIQSLSVKHNMEMAHRLFLTPGKCEAIHGHSWWVTLTCWGEVDAKGIVQGVTFGDLKYLLRSYMDEHFDHHLLLNRDDPFAGPVSVQDIASGWTTLPGLVRVDGDPTTENVAATIGTYMTEELRTKGIKLVQVETWETATNCATWVNSPEMLKWHNQ